MKKYLFLVVALVLVSCADQLLVDEVAVKPVEQDATNEVSALMEKARWGDGEAYVKLADCYRDGHGLKQDFIGMLGMASFAVEYGGVECMEDYISSLPTESVYKVLFDAMEEFSRGNQDSALAMAEKLIAQECLEGYTMKGIILTEQGNAEEGKTLLELAAGKGSGFAELYLCVPDWYHGKKADVAKLAALSDRMPIASACLGKIYSRKDGEVVKDEKQAAYYYMRADEKACLTRDGARWLLAYYRNGDNLKLSKRDVERLEVLAGVHIIEDYEDDY